MLQMPCACGTQLSTQHTNPHSYQLNRWWCSPVNSLQPVASPAEHRSPLLQSLRYRWYSCCLSATIRGEGPT
jgi:hypothetical protein